MCGRAGAFLVVPLGAALATYPYRRAALRGRVAVPIGRPCIEAGCRAMARPGYPRCYEHEAGRAYRRRAARAAAPGDGAAVRARRRINARGSAVCARCGTTTPAALVEVDHKIPLADGGTDYADNVAPLCRPCHRRKTADEARARRSRGNLEG